MPRRSRTRPNGDRPLDVLIVSQPADYGVAIYVRELAGSAVEAGHHVTVISPPESRGPLAGWVKSVGARHHTLDMARRPALRDPFDVLALRRLARGRDVLHVHSSKATRPTRGRDDSPLLVVARRWPAGGPLPVDRAAARSPLR